MHTPMERLLEAINRRPVDRIPVVAFTQTGTVELMQAVGVFWPGAHRDARDMARLALAAFRLGGFENVRVPFGIHSEVEALGCPVDYHEGKIDRTPTSEALGSLAELKEDADPSTSPSTRVVLDAVATLKEELPPEVPVVAGILGPFQVSSHLMGIVDFLKMLIRMPEEARRVLEVASAFQRRFMSELSSAGADVLAMVDSVATGELIGPRIYERFVLPYTRDVVAVAKVPVVMHMCGDCTKTIHLIAKTGVKGISIDQKVSIGAARELSGGRLAIAGNINPVDMLMKQPREVEEKARHVLAEHPDIISPGCGLPPRTPLANIEALTTIAKAFGGT